MRPSCMTATRSETPITSSMSDEIISTATPAVGEPAHQAIDFGLGADVDAARRLVEDDDLGLHGQPLGEHDLLLVAARERAGALRDVGARMSSSRPALLAPAPLGLARDEAAWRIGAEVRAA